MDAFECPFCGLTVDESHPHVITPLFVFERHLDVHMAVGDRLPERGVAA